MFDPLIHGEDGEIARPLQTAVVKERLQAAKDRGLPVASQPDAPDKIRTREVKLFLRNSLAFVLEKITRAFAEEILNFLD